MDKVFEVTALDLSALPLSIFDMFAEAHVAKPSETRLKDLEAFCAIVVEDIEHVTQKHAGFYEKFQSIEDLRLRKIKRDYNFSVSRLWESDYPLADIQAVNGNLQAEFFGACDGVYKLKQQEWGAYLDQREHFVHKLIVAVSNIAEGCVAEDDHLLKTIKTDYFDGLESLTRSYFERIRNSGEKTDTELHHYIGACKLAFDEFKHCVRRATGLVQSTQDPETRRDL